MNNHCKFSETVAQNQISAPNPPARPKNSYSIVWKACPCLRLHPCLRHPRSAIPSIASIASIVSIASIASIAHLPASPPTMLSGKPQACFFSAEPTFFPRSGFFFGRRGM